MHHLNTYFKHVDNTGTFMKALVSKIQLNMRPLSYFVMIIVSVLRAGVSLCTTFFLKQSVHRTVRGSPVWGRCYLFPGPAP